MFEDIPRTFDTVVARDLWLWDHENVPLLSYSDKEDRLLLFPNYDTKRPFGYEWAQYSYEVAEALENQQRWPEAQAYWLASAQMLAQDGKKNTEDFARAIAGIVRTGGRSSGMHLDRNNSSIEEMVETGALSYSVPLQEAILRSLLMVGITEPSIYEMVTSSQTRKVCAEELTRMLPYLKFDLQQQKRKGSHEIFTQIIQTYTQDMNQLRMLVDGMVVSPTLDHMKSQREKLLKILTKLPYVIFEYDKIIYSRVYSLLTSRFTNYVRFSEEINEEAFDDFIQDVHSIIEEIRGVGSHLSASIFAPMILCLGAAVNAHYQGNIVSKIPDLKIRLLKPSAYREDNASFLEIEIVNDGTGAAYDCELKLQSSESMGMTFENADLWYGRVEPNYPKIQQCKMIYLSSKIVSDIECTLEWRDRRGTHTQHDILKIIRQQVINWNVLELAEAPYTIQSITDPEKLKGRDEQIRMLRLGFQGKNSFMITGQKRVGKTSLVQVFLSQLNSLPSVLPLYIPIGELSASSYDDLGQLGWELAKRVIEGYKIKYQKNISVLVPNIEEFRNSFNFTFPEFVREFLRVYPLRLAFALDDFDELSTQLFSGPVGKSFFLTLRALINNGTSFFFIGSERLPAIMSEQAERLNQVKSLKVDYLSREAIIALAKEPVKEWLEYTNDAIVEIEVWSARNPFFATLICNAVWERALKMRDYWITKRDVEYAVNDLAKASDRNSYQHFWSDSPLAQEEERSRYSTKSVYIILALNKHQPSPLAFAERQTVLKNCEGLNAGETNQHLQELINYDVIETHRDNTNLIRLRVPLFALWLQGDGALELRQSEIAKGRLNTLLQRPNELSHDEVIIVTEGLSYRGEKITTDQVRAWASQFGPVRDQRLMLKLLRNLRDNGLFNETKFVYALRKLHELARLEAARHNVVMQMGARNTIMNWYVMHIDQSGKSGSSIAKQYRSLNNIPASQCGDQEKVLSAIMNSRNRQVVLICVDDFVGTGFSATKGLSTLITQLDNTIRDWRDKVLLMYATVVGFEEGLKCIEEELLSSSVILIPFKILTNADRAFNEENTLFQNADERMQAQDIALKIGKVLEKRHPLGREDSQALVVFPDNVPNNTLPIFYKNGIEYNGKLWNALFPRS